MSAASSRLPRTRPSVPIGFAHQGGRFDHPQNTIPAFELALAGHATGLESDVWLTRDGVAVLDHDGVAVVDHDEVPISTLDRADLPAHIPTLSELYALCGADTWLSLDVRDPGAVGPILAAARAAGDAAVRHLWLCAELLAEAEAWRAAGADVGIAHSTELELMPDGVAAHARVLSGLGIDVLNLHESEWDAGAVAATHDAGLLAYGWDAQTRQSIQRLVALGCDGIYSDDVDLLVDVLEPAGSAVRQRPGTG